MQKLALSWKRKGIRTAFVPTMGYLHGGHVSLIKAGRRLAGRRGKVVVSVFVNPMQFGPNEDFKQYPRNLSRDKRLCAVAGVDVLFVPGDAVMYSKKEGEAFSTYVAEEELSKTMEGAARPGHFRGVTTVVAKLFHLVLPDYAVFGAKDFQQAAIIRRMVRDLNFPTEVMVVPTKREPDGLAMSSRNRYLSAEERQQATVLWNALKLAQTIVRDRQEIPADELKQRLRAKIQEAPAAQIDYIELFDPRTFQPWTVAKKGTHLALAVWMGKTRLIDNASL